MYRHESYHLGALRQIVKQKGYTPTEDDQGDEVDFYLNQKPATWRLISACVNTEIGGRTTYHFFWMIPEPTPNA